MYPGLRTYIVDERPQDAYYRNWHCYGWCCRGDLLITGVYLPDSQHPVRVGPDHLDPVSHIGHWLEYGSTRQSILLRACLRCRELHPFLPLGLVLLRVDPCRRGWVLDAAPKRGSCLPAECLERVAGKITYIYICSSRKQE